MKALFATLFVSLMAVTSPAAAQTAERKDLQVFNDIAKQVNGYTQLTIFDSISASVDQGRVVLSGWVTMPYKKDDLERRVSGVPLGPGLLRELVELGERRELARRGDPADVRDVDPDEVDQPVSDERHVLRLVDVELAHRERRAGGGSGSAADAG